MGRGLCAHPLGEKPLSRKHLLGFGGYVSVVSGLMVFLVIQTALRQQDAAMKDTRERLDRTVDTFREKLDEQGAKLLDRTLEKVDLTKSEWEVRADLQEEAVSPCAHKSRSQGSARQAWADAGGADGRRERPRCLFGQPEHGTRAQTGLADAPRTGGGAPQEDPRKSRPYARESRGRGGARRPGQKEEIARLRASVQRAEQRARQALKNAATAQTELINAMIRQGRAADTLQAAVDSIYGKVMKRPRNP